jgi:hypothetical protein
MLDALPKDGIRDRRAPAAAYRRPQDGVRSGISVAARCAANEEED